MEVSTKPVHAAEFTSMGKIVNDIQVHDPRVTVTICVHKKRLGYEVIPRLYKTAEFS